MATVVRFGGMLSFFVVILADRYGRKPIISVTVLCYTVLTLFTALSVGVGSFTIFQSLAQIFLAAEFGVAVTMISEEFPDRAPRPRDRRACTWSPFSACWLPL